MSDPQAGCTLQPAFRYRLFKIAVDQLDKVVILRNTLTDSFQIRKFVWVKLMGNIVLTGSNTDIKPINQGDLY